MFDVVQGNIHVIADSNHGYKMIGVGALIAEEVRGAAAPLLEPFRYDRFERGARHPVSSSPDRLPAAVPDFPLLARWLAQPHVQRW